MSDYSELKRLAEAATPGPWQTELEYPIIQPAYPARGSIASALIWQDANFISAANPAAVLALISEVEHLAAQVRLAGVAGEMAVHDTAGRAATEYMVVVQELDQLKAKVEALRKDAERYRWLRQYTVKSLPVSGALESLDRDIDATMTKGGKP